MNAETHKSSAEKTASTVRILVADDHEVMRLGIRNLLESTPSWTVCGEAGNGQEAVEKTLQLQPDLVILDITMPAMNGIEAAKQIARSHAEIPIILFSLHLSDDLMSSFANSSIRGAVSKEEAGRDLVDAVATVLRGGTFFRKKKPLTTQ